MDTRARTGLRASIIALIVLLGVVSAAIAIPIEAQGTTTAELTALSVSVGTLSPAFDADTVTYTVTGLSNSL